MTAGRAGRRATDAFSTTRALGLFPDDVTPLGASRLRILGDPDVEVGYLWGDDGPTALLVHGWGTDSSSMHSLVPPLRRLGLRAAAFDAPGHGVSPGHQATMTEFTRATGAVLETLGDVEVIVAHSLGSIAAVSALEARPATSVRCLVLLAPTCTLSGVLERWAAGAGRLSPGMKERVYRELEHRNGVPVSHWDIAARGRDLDVPVLVVHDPDDPVVPFAEAESVVAALPNPRLAEAPGHGHIGILTTPSVKSLMAEFTAGRRVDA